MTDTDRNPTLAREFTEKHGFTLYEIALKLSEEQGEVAEAVLGHNGGLLFKDDVTQDELGEELADLISTCYYVADLAGIDDLDERTTSRLQANLSRDTPDDPSNS